MFTILHVLETTSIHDGMWERVYLFLFMYLP